MPRHRKHPEFLYPDSYVLDHENRPLRRCMEVVRIAEKDKKPPRGFTEFEQIQTDKDGQKSVKKFWIKCRQLKPCPRGFKTGFVFVTVRYPNGTEVTDFKCRCQKAKESR